MTATTTELINPTPASGIVQQGRLRVTSGIDAGKVHSASGNRILVGTHHSNDFVLTDPAVSRFHLELLVSGSRTRLRDVGSSNGTLIDGVSVVEGHLRHGSMIQLGRSELRFELGQDQVHIPMSGSDRFGRMVGSSPAMRAMFASLERAAASTATVLLIGETGTGKDLAAEMLHAHGPRAQGPFVVVDCGALPANLMESELFGHEKAAFTGADRARMGAVEAASGGTLFLDEVGELAPDLQPKLLRVLESRHVQRIGSTQRTPVDVRVIAATNRNLRAEVNTRRFRSDLYYRLAVITVNVPPLRERLEDLPQLVDALLTSICAPDDPRSEPLRSKPFLTEIARHGWPGNVRELRNYLERCFTLQETAPPQDIDGASAAIDTKLPLGLARERWVRTFERHYALALLAEHGDNISAAARAAGIDRTTMHRLMARSGVRPKAE